VEDVELSPDWNVGRNQNGGRLLATLGSAMAGAAGHPHPFSVTGHYLAATEAGPATVSADVVKPGRTYATAVGSLVQGDRERLRAVGAFGDLSARAAEGDSSLRPAPADIPGPDGCTDLFEILTAGPAGERALTRSLRNFEIRVDPERGWGTLTGEPILSGWIRYRALDTVDAAGLVTLADAFPPTIMGSAEIGWLPTIELTVHLFGLPPADEPWLRAELRTRSVVGGLLDEDGELWDATGALVARFRQLALVLPKR
jgi:acyl-CoA thioesterase